MGFVLSIFAPTPVTPGTGIPVPPQPNPPNPYHTTDANDNPVTLEAIDVDRKILGGFPDDDTIYRGEGGLRKLRF